MKVSYWWYQSLVFIFSQLIIMAKFKVWQKVRIFPIEGLLSRHKDCVKRFAKKTLEIVDVLRSIGDTEYVYKLAWMSYIWHEDRLEAVEETNPTEEIKQGDLVWVSNQSEEEARKNKLKRQFIYSLPWNPASRYVTTQREDRIDGNRYFVSTWDYIVPIPKEQPKKKRRVTCTDEQWEEIQKLVKPK